MPRDVPYLLVSTRPSVSGGVLHMHSRGRCESSCRQRNTPPCHTLCCAVQGLKRWAHTWPYPCYALCCAVQKRGSVGRVCDKAHQYSQPGAEAAAVLALLCCPVLCSAGPDNKVSWVLKQSAVAGRICDQARQQGQPGVEAAAGGSSCRHGGHQCRQLGGQPGACTGAGARPSAGVRTHPASIKGTALQVLRLSTSLKVESHGVSKSTKPGLAVILTPSHLQARHNAIVAHESRAEWVNGHILAIPFSDRYAEALTEAVLNTGIHRIADERVKYSMAAHVEHAGAAFCCCLWVYVAVTR
eukprot:scaffold55216_cov21-Tisochrysis_lutea.AAC.2